LNISPENFSVDIKHIHPWMVDCAEARNIQDRLSRLVEITPLKKAVHCIAGADIAYSARDNWLIAGVIVFTFPHLDIIEQVWAEGEASFPYLPGFLTFREAPTLLAALARLRHDPDIIVLDGQGIAHPRRLGLASHIGVILDIPSIGCAKKRLFGKYTEPGEQKGEYTFLYHKEEIIGAALRTKSRVKPVFISVGHKVDLEGALQIILACTGKYRLPEPTRQAHILVNRLGKEKT